jgi:rfaE bifunctional protein kinase chain/domain
MTYAELLARFASQRVLVIGDLMLDEYIHGRATRISQEAPVMVVRQQRVHAVPGGAANVAKNLVALGATAHILGVIGDDEPGSRLRSTLADQASTLIVDSSRPTTRKTRVLADSAHQVLRIDDESTEPVSESIEAQLLAVATELLLDCDVILFSDYVKGVLKPSLIQAIIRAAMERGVVCVANAKPASRLAYRGANLVSLNRPEAEQASGVARIETSAQAALVAEALRKEIGVQHVLVTLNDDGMVTERHQIPPVRVEVFDTAGAGDTTIATVALGISVAGDAPEVFALAAETAAAVVRKVGVAVPSPEDIALIANRGIL